MQADTGTSTTRRYVIEDQGDGFDLALFEGDLQVGGAWLPDGGDGSAFEYAQELAAAWMS